MAKSNPKTERKSGKESLRQACEPGDIRLPGRADGETLSAMEANAETLPAKVRIEQLERKNEILEREVEELKKKVDQLLRKKGDGQTLSQSQLSVFSRLEAIQETGDKARKLAQRVLADLADAPATKALVERLKSYLKSRSWGIVTANGHAAAPVWQADEGKPLGGYMRLQYTDPATGSTVQPESHGRMPRITLAERPDRRKRLQNG